MMESIFMQKAGIATKGVAHIISTIEVGEKLPTITQMSKQLDTARGNIQLAISNLKQLGVLTIKTRGHLGSFLEQVDYCRLAEVCGVCALIGVMPLPYSRRYEGLATGIYKACNFRKFRGSIAFMRGAENRLSALKMGRYDFMLLSALSYEYYKSRGEPIVKVFELCDGSYVGEHKLILGSGFDGNFTGCWVGIDESSVDQRLLSVSYFSHHHVCFVPMKYHQLFSYLARGDIDVAVWNGDDLKSEMVERQNDNSFASLPLCNIPNQKEATRAVLACRSDDNVTIRLLKEIMKPEEVLQKQQDVCNGSSVPRY